MAGADPAHLRALILPDYSQVAMSFSELLFRVVRRCKRNSQVYRHERGNESLRRVLPIFYRVDGVNQAFLRQGCYHYIPAHEQL